MTRRPLPYSLLLGVCGVVACGAPPAPAPAAAPLPVATDTKPEIDLSPVGEPGGVVAVGRVKQPEALVAAVGGWAKMPLPSGAELVRSIGEDAVADVIDLSQPVDIAVKLSLGRNGVDPVIALAVPVRSYDAAAERLGAQHKLVRGQNGELKVEGLGRRPGRDPDLEAESDLGCVLAHATPAPAARLVCAKQAGLEVMVPYMTRTMPRAQWKSDVHLELRPRLVRMLSGQLRGSIPAITASLVGSGATTADKELVEGVVGEGIDILDDAQNVAIDAEVGTQSGVVASARFDFEGKKSTFARMTTMTDRAGEIPPALRHLPGDADTAFFGRGSDPRLFDRPREILAHLLVASADAAGLPEADQKALGDLVAAKLLPLFTNGPGVYAKGFDHAAVEKTIKARAALNVDDTPAQAEARLVLLEQVVGWHLYQTSEAIAKVGPMLKEWPAFFARAGLAKWAKSKSVTLPRMRIAPAPAGVTLPKETVHLEVTIPRDDIDDERTSRDPRAKKKKIARRPGIFHVLAVPDGESTWLALGMDAKLLAQKAAVSLSTAPDTGTLGKTPALDGLKDKNLNLGGMFTLRGVVALGALDGADERSAVNLGLPNKGITPATFSGKAESANAFVGSLRLDKPFLEDLIRLVMATL